MKLPKAAQDSIEKAIREGRAVVTGAPMAEAVASCRLDGETHCMPPITEKQFMAAVINLAKRNGFLVYHTRNSRGSEKGFPDLVLVRPYRRGDNPPPGVARFAGRIVFAELKVGDGKLTAAQETWRDTLCAADAEYYLWRETAWPLIEEVLR